MPATVKRRTISQRSEMIYDAHNFGLILDTREVFISLSETTLMIDWDTTRQFLINLQILNSISKEPILVHLITCGGSWDYAMGIYDAIEHSNADPKLANVSTLSYAHARSMSSIIPQAAKYRVIMPTSYFMMHDGEYGDSGNVKTVFSGVDFYKNVANPRMIDIYVEKCKAGKKFQNWTEEKIRAEIEKQIAYKDDVYLTAREAVEWGLMDAVLGDEGFETIKMLKVDYEEEEE